MEFLCDIVIVVPHAVKTLYHKRTLDGLLCRLSFKYETFKLLHDTSCGIFAHLEECAELCRRNTFHKLFLHLTLGIKQLLAVFGVYSLYTAS